MPRRTALIVPVPEADSCYTGPPGVGAHVTVLYPFAADDSIDETALETLFACFEPFAFVLDRVEQPADGLRWLHPEPAAPLRALIDAVWARWPDHPPYEGTIDDPTPHVTITRLDLALPVACRASEVVLLAENVDGTFETLRRFSLGQGVA
jgi:2'-5' RNA ligase superfamily